MNKSIFTELEHYGEILEKHFHDMMDVEFTVENGKLYILSARIGKRSKLANLKIVMSMFCEGKMSVEDVIKKIPYQRNKIKHTVFKKNAVKFSILERTGGCTFN